MVLITILQELQPFFDILHAVQPEAIIYNDVTLNLTHTIYTCSIPREMFVSNAATCRRSLKEAASPCSPAPSGN